MDARAQEGPHQAAVRSKAIQTVKEPRVALPRLVADLPKNTELAIFVPHVDLALSDLHAFMSAMHVLDADPANQTIGAWLARQLGVEGMEPKDALSALLTPAGLAAIGVDAGGAAVIVPPLFGEPAVFAVELQNRPRFENWLEQLAPGDTRRVTIGGEQASVLFANHERPLACLARRSTAYCQLGAAPGADPIAPLRGVVSMQSPSLGSVAAIGRAFSRLPEGAHAYAFLHGDPAAKAAPEIALAWAERNYRFDGRKKIVENAQAIAPKIRAAAEMLEGGAGGLYLTGDRVSFETELSIGERGAKMLRELSVASDDGALIPRWFETPALARVLVRMNGTRAEQLLANAGLDVPAGSLSGTLALLLFGVDSECPLAKKQDSAAMGWAFMLPSAFAVGLRGPSSADAVQNMLVAKLPASEAQVDPVEAKDAKETTVVERRAVREPMRAQMFGSAFEVQVLDEIALVGTGPGSGAAAMRRMRSLTPDSRSSEPHAFVHAAIHPRAIDAALDAGNISHENRRELWMLEAMRRRMRPLLQQIDVIELVGRVNESERRMTLELEMSR